MKLKDLLGYIKTYDHIKLSNYDGEEFHPTYADVDRYKEYFVTEINAYDKNVLLILIKPTEQVTILRNNSKKG